MIKHSKYKPSLISSDHFRSFQFYFLFYPTEVVEHCCSIPSLQLGESMSGIAKDMDTITYRLPLGVTAGITPFNFPAMIPLWVSELTAVLH